MVEKKALEAIFTKSLQLKPEESCLIVTDTEKEQIGRSFYDFSALISSRTKIVVMKTTAEHAQEPPDNIAQEMLKFDVEILITDKSLSHTKARRDASKKGVRIVSMPSISEDIINRCCDIDYALLKKDSQKLYGFLKDAGNVRITTQLGTDIVFKVGENKWFGENGGSFDYPGAFGNLPEGEVSFSPLECEGIYIVDASFPGLGILKSPLVFKVKNSFVYTIEGENSSQVVERLERSGKLAYRVAELGIGLNPKAKITGIVLEDEKVRGTVHIAVGNNLSYGGDNDVPLHLDGVITRPNIYADKRLIMQDGNFII